MPWRLRLLPALDAKALEPRISGGVGFMDATSKASGFAAGPATAGDCDGSCGGSPNANGASAAANRRAVWIAGTCGEIRKALILNSRSDMVNIRRCGGA